MSVSSGKTHKRTNAHHQTTLIHQTPQHSHHLPYHSPPLADHLLHHHPPITSFTTTHSPPPLPPPTHHLLHHHQPITSLTSFTDAVLSFVSAVLNRRRMRMHLLAILGENPSRAALPDVVSRERADAVSLGGCYV